MPNRTAGLLQGGPRIRCDEGWGFRALHRVFGVMVGVEGFRAFRVSDFRVSG